MSIVVNGVNVNGRYNEEHKYVNDYGDKHFGAYPSAIKFFTVLNGVLMLMLIFPICYFYELL